MSRPRTLERDLLSTLWQQPLLAIPFAIFFSLIYAPSWRGLSLLYLVALVFAVVIRLAILGTRHALVPLLVAGRDPAVSPRQAAFWIEGAAYAVSALLGSFLSAWLVHVTLWRGFLGGRHSVMQVGGYALLFTLLFTGLAYAVYFYREAVDRAQAAEQARTELARAELRALRAQIQPHFLFNTLNTIAALIAESPRAAEDTVTRLAEVFRYVLATSGQEQAPLGAELRFVRDVLAIERLRFGDRLAVVEEVEGGLDDLPVPSLLLQPIVENAVRHGVSARPAGGTVRLAARRAGPLLLLEVEDDGPGLDVAAPGATGTGFGLRSVRERLEALGPPHAIEIHSPPGRGTLVRITLPVGSGAAATA